MAAEKTLIFIPDISGFTKFVTETEIQHSQHIISELLEKIIENDILGLEISEIEGDAILFYKTGDKPTVEKLIEQVKKMFIAFHEQIKLIERDNVCQCGACTTVVNLTLKFIVHSGLLHLAKVHTFQKLMGSDMILAHRLLKNNLELDEYLLATASFTEKIDSFENWMLPKESNIDIDSFGVVPFNYISLSPLHNEVNVPTKDENIKTIGKPIQYSISVMSPLKLVHTNLIDPEMKLNYTDGLKAIKSNSKINRVRSGHVCIFEGMSIDFTTLKNEVKQNKIIYIEKGESSIGLSFTAEYTLTSINNGTNINLKIYPEAKGNYSEKEIAESFAGLEKVLANFKIFCEEK